MPSNSPTKDAMNNLQNSPVLQTRALGLTVGARELFRDLNLTVDAGQCLGVLGQNDLSQFADVADALNGLLRAAPPGPARIESHVFSVAQEVIKLSDRFTMAFDRSTQNFTALAQGAVIATDGDTVYSVKHAEELVVFPNPDVRVGLRAGLMVVRQA